MDDLLENTTVIPLVQFLAHICRVVVSKVWLVFLEFFTCRRRRCSISALKARRVASVKSFPLSVASLLFQEALLLLLLMVTTLNSDICKFRPEVKHEMQCEARFWRKRAVVLVKSGVDLEIRI